jgi:RNA polymerase-interacting CarD/CdnL/TRCF family regulator
VFIEIRTVEVADTPQHYYAVELFNGEVLMVPVDKADEIGLRPVLLNPIDVVAVLSDCGGELPEDADARRAYLTEKVNENDPTLVAEVLRDLVWWERSAPLSQEESEIKDKALYFLACEFAFHIHAGVETAARRLMAILERSPVRKVA